MSTCDCDRKAFNGGSCDSSCNDVPVEKNSSNVTFEPVMAVTAATTVVGSAFVEGCCTATQPCL